jgi:hypothetical protein
LKVDVLVLHLKKNLNLLLTPFKQNLADNFLVFEKLTNLCRLVRYSEQHEALCYFAIDRIYDPVLISLFSISISASRLVALMQHHFGMKILHRLCRIFYFGSTT